MSKLNRLLTKLINNNIYLGNNEQQIRKIQIIDMAGRIVKQIIVNKELSISVPAQELHGLYLVKMSGNKVITEKIIIE